MSTESRARRPLGRLGIALLLPWLTLVAVGCIGPRRSFDLNDLAQNTDTSANDANDGDSNADVASFPPSGSLAIAPTRVSDDVTVFAYDLQRPPFEFVATDDRLLHLSVEDKATLLVSTKLQGGTTPLSPAGNPNGRVRDFRVSGSYVFALGNTENEQIRGIYRSSFDSGEAFHVTAPAVVSGKLDVVEFRVLDDDHLIFAANTATAGLPGLYLIGTGGGSLTALIAGDAVLRDNTTIPGRLRYTVLPLAAGVVYLSDPLVDGARRLVHVRGLLPRVDTLELAPGTQGDFDVVDYLVSPDKNRVIYLASDRTSGAHWLGTVRLTGAGVLRLSPDLDTSNSVHSLALANDGRTLLFVVEEPTPRISSIYLTLVDRASTELTRVTPATTGTDDRIVDFLLAENILIYLRESQSRRQLVELDLQGLAPEIVLRDDPVEGEHVVSLMRVGTRLLFETEDGTGRGRRLFAAEIGSSVATALTPTLSPTFSGVRDFVVDTSSMRIAIVGQFRADPAVDVIVTTASASPFLIVTPSDKGNALPSVGAIAFHPDGKRLIFTGDFIQNGIFRLYQATLAL